jgi:hypothetical protein
MSNAIMALELGNVNHATIGLANVNLFSVVSYYGLAAKTNAGQNHSQLLSGHILSLVNDYERVL